MRQYAETGLVAIDLANTWDEYLDDPERLPDVSALRRFCAELGVPGFGDPGAEPASMTSSAQAGASPTGLPAAPAPAPASDPGPDPEAGAAGGSETGAGPAGAAGDLDSGAGPAGVLGDSDPRAGSVSAADLDEVRAVRSRLRRVLEGDPARRARALARWADEAPMRAVVAESAGTPVLRLAAPSTASLGQRLTVRAVTELLDLAASGDWERLRLCAASPCQDAFVDRSRPGRRQFCSTRCANRAHAAASRARHR
ncbi:hypothetical protein GCM10009733_026910 [Nonomuraea maheshkhaliensis]|uniref:Zinc finger CGNR domain-containing protein n=1 Tax=Nonomuraea maheshkhaliensis TaxID=419590 RepID=A0ABN2F3F9_9ACTN